MHRWAVRTGDGVPYEVEGDLLKMAGGGVQVTKDAATVAFLPLDCVVIRVDMLKSSKPRAGADK